jgi:hypothetical protein
MSHFFRSGFLAGAVAIACMTVLSGCWHRHRDVVVVDRAHVDDHHDHHEERHDDHR